MSKTKIIDIHGKVKYIHAVNIGKYGYWDVVLYPDEASLNIINELKSQGLKNHLKKDDDGYYMLFKREPQKVMRGVMVPFMAPKVVLHNPDKPSEPKPFDGNKVGYGSDVTARLEVYPYGGKGGVAPGIACRWDSLKVNNLVEFNIDKSDWPEEEKENIKSLGASPEPELW